MCQMCFLTFIIYLFKWKNIYLSMYKVTTQVRRRWKKTCLCFWISSPVVASNSNYWKLPRVAFPITNSVIVVPTDKNSEILNSRPKVPTQTGKKDISRLFPLTCTSAICACVCWLKRVSLTLAKTPHRGLLIYSVFINRIYVVLWRLQCP